MKRLTGMHDCVQVLCTVLLLFHFGASAAVDSGGPLRFRAQSFRNSTTIQGRQVHCGAIPTKEKRNTYPSDVWACYNISVSGLRLEYETGLGHVYQQQDKDEVKSDFTGDNDMLQLCRFLMRAHGVDSQLWFAQAKDITVSSVQLPRIILVRANGDVPAVFEWSVRNERHSFIGTLLCTATQQQ